MAVQNPATERVAAPVAAAPARPGSRQGSALLGALLALVLVATASDGASSVQAQSRLQLALAGLALLAVAFWAADRGISLRARPAAATALAALLALATWSALSLLWSVAPDRSWAEVNRTLACLIAVALALAAGSSAPRAVERAAGAWLAGVTLMALYALAGKLVPGLGLADHDAVLAGLSAPLGTPGALGLVLATAMPVALRLGADPTRPWPWRWCGLAAATVLGVALGATLAGQGWVAAGVALAVLVALGPRRAALMLALAAVAAATAVPLALVLGSDPLTTARAAAGDRAHDGWVALVALAVVLGVLAAGTWGATRVRVGRRLLDALALGVVVAALAAGALALASGSGLTGLRHQITQTRGGFPAPGRPGHTVAGNRSDRWGEAAGAGSDRPVAGYGAGAFAAVHLRRRTAPLEAEHASSVPMDLLAETGGVGLATLGLALGALGWAGVAALRARTDGPGRDATAAVLAAGAAWVAHAALDSDWALPGVTLPVLVLLGVVAGAHARRRPEPGGPPPVVFVDPGRPARRIPGRAALVALAVLTLGAVAVSAWLPAAAERRADGVERVLADPRAAEPTLRDASGEADLAARLNRLSVEGLITGAQVAERRGRLLDARRLALEAVDRQPHSAASWSALAEVAFALVDRPGFQAASARALALDPLDPTRRLVAERAVAFAAPATSSATATGTPLAPAAPPAP